MPEPVAPTPPEPFVPPAPALTPEPPHPAPPAGSPGTHPHPGGYPGAHYASPAPRASRRRRFWIAIAVIVPSALLLGGIAWGLIAVGTAFGEIARGPYAGDPSLVEGDPGSPIAEAPLECEVACFTVDDAERLLASQAAFDEFGLTETPYPFGTYDPSTVGEGYRAMSAGWEANDGTPDSCFFAPTNSPLSGAPDEALATSTDPVLFIGTHEDPARMNTLDQSLRVFPDSASASEYLAGLATAVDDCREVTIGPPAERYSASIAPAAQLALPDSVAGVGWTRTGDPGPRWRAYVVDLQRGNVVVRTRLLTDGSTSEIAFRGWVEGYSLIISSLRPAPQ